MSAYPPRPAAEHGLPTSEERAWLLVQLQDDEVAVRRDLPDLVFLTLATACASGSR